MSTMALSKIFTPVKNIFRLGLAAALLVSLTCPMAHAGRDSGGGLSKETTEGALDNERAKDGDDAIDSGRDSGGGLGKELVVAEDKDAELLKK